MRNGHISKSCKARQYDVPKGFMKWILKGSRKALPCWIQPIKGYHVMYICFAGYQK